MKIETAAIMDDLLPAAPVPAASPDPASPSGELFTALLDLAGAACAPIADAPQLAEGADDPAGAGPSRSVDAAQSRSAAGAPAAPGERSSFAPLRPILACRPGERAGCVPPFEVRCQQSPEASRPRALGEQLMELFSTAAAKSEAARPAGPDNAAVARSAQRGRACTGIPAALSGKPTTGMPAFIPIPGAGIQEALAPAPPTLQEDRALPGVERAPQPARVPFGYPMQAVAQTGPDSGGEAVPAGGCSAPSPEHRDPALTATAAAAAVCAAGEVVTAATPEQGDTRQALPALPPGSARTETAPEAMAIADWFAAARAWAARTDRVGLTPAWPFENGEDRSDAPATPSEGQVGPSGAVYRVAAIKTLPLLRQLAEPEASITHRGSEEIRASGDSRPAGASPEALSETGFESEGSQRPTEKRTQHAAKIAESEWISGLLLHPAHDAEPAAASLASRLPTAIVAPGCAGGSASAVHATALAGTGRPTLHAQAEIVSSEIDFLPRLAEQIYLRVREGGNVLRIQLRPGGLGRMEIRAECSGPSMSAAILTESSWVRTYVEQNLAALYQNLQDLGLKVDRLVVLEDAWARHPSAQQGDHGSRPQDERGQELHPRSRPEPEASSAESPAGPVSSVYILRGLYSTFHAVA